MLAGLGETEELSVLLRATAFVLLAQVTIREEN